MNKLLPLFAALSACVANPAVAQSSSSCGTLQHVNAHLAQDYGETALVTLQDFSDNAFIVYTNIDTKSWTLVHINPTTYETCIINAGDDLAIGPVEQVVAEELKRQQDDEPTY